MNLKKIYIKDILKKNIGSKIETSGWVHSIRDIGKLTFIILRDKTGTIQLTFKKNILGEKYNLLKDINNESIILVKGVLSEKRGGGKEIIVEDFKIISKADPLPIEIWNPDVNTSFIKRVQYRFLDLRRPEILKIFKIRSDLVKYLREFLIKNGYIEFHTPKIVSMGAESGAEVFEIKYYDNKAYLPQSPQLYKQMLMASGVDKYFEFGWYWRAEKSHTNRHLSEFYGLDIEISWINSHLEIAKEVIKCLSYAFLKLNKKYNLNLNIPKKIPIISFKKAIKILKKEYNLNLDNDLNSQAEFLIGKYIREKYNSDLVVIINYPWIERPFYHMRLEKNKEYTKSFDILFKGLEISTGAQREHRYNILIEQIQEKNINPETMKYYLESFKYGMPPHGGAGIGIDRVVKQLLDLKDIRESTLWFRDPEHYYP